MSGAKMSDIRHGPESDTRHLPSTATTEYCAKLQQWMWQYYWGYANWQSWMTLTAFPFSPPCTFPPPGTGAQPSGAPVSNSRQQTYDPANWYSYPYPLSFPASASHPGGTQTGQSSATTPAAPAAAADGRAAQQQNGNPPQAGREYTIPSPLQRFLAETVDFFILFCVKATIVLYIMHLSGMKDIAKFITHFIVEEIDENTSMEDLQKMMAVALVYRVLVCVYEIQSCCTTLLPTEDSDATLYAQLPDVKSYVAALVRLVCVSGLFSQVICIWGTGGATPGKFLLGLRVVTCDTSTLVRPNRVLVVPASNVSLSASTVRALNKNFSIAFLFPVFITLLFFQHNRTVYDIVAGTIVVQRRGGR